MKLNSFDKAFVILLAIIFFITLISAIASASSYEPYNHSSYIVTAYGERVDFSGMKIQVNESVTNSLRVKIIGLTKVGTLNISTIPQIRSSANSLVATGTNWSGLNSTFDYLYPKNTPIWVGALGDGSTTSAIWSSSAPPHPTNSSNVTWIKGIFFEAESVSASNIAGLTLDYLPYQNYSITSPASNSVQTSQTVTLQINATSIEGYSSCFYNVTRGASLEISNTTLLGCSNITTFTVSADGTYTVHFYGSDTAGNVEYTNSTFSVNTNSNNNGASGGASGGGGSFIAQVIPNRESVSAKCNVYNPAFIQAWDQVRKEGLSAVLLQQLWDSFWNYGICASAASIVPI